MKKTNKKYSYIVDLTNVKTLLDIDVAYGIAKHNAGLPISDQELEAIVLDAIEKFGPSITIIDCNCECQKPKKPNIFKRFWRWMLGKK